MCNKVWNLDDESMKYLEKRLSDDWEPVPEFKALIDALKEKGAIYGTGNSSIRVYRLHGQR